jgi:LPS-assembly protein
MHGFAACSVRWRALAVVDAVADEQQRTTRAGFFMPLQRDTAINTRLSMIPFRRHPLALLLGCTLAGLVASPALAQALPPLAVDPLLLGLPAATPVAKPAAPAAASQEVAGKGAAVATEPATNPNVIVRPVAAPQVSPVEAPAPAVAPAAVEPAPARTPSVPSAPPAPPASAPLPNNAASAAPQAAEATRRPPVAAPLVAQSVPRSAPQGSHRALPALQVDPALLGLPAAPAAVAQATAGASSTGSATAGVPAGVAEMAAELLLRSTPALLPLTKKSDEPRPVFVTANRIFGKNEVQTVAEGDVELRKIGTVLNADKLTYWPAEDETEALGNVVLTQERGVVKGPKLRLMIGDQTGFFETPSYIFRQESKRDGVAHTAIGRGEAERIDFEGEDKMALTNATYSTCKPGNNSWFARVDNLKLDYERQEGEGDNGTIYFKDVPILYSPWVSFALDNARKSGFLSPTFGSTSLGGFDLTVPYYWNIAPNHDATIVPRIFTKRGMQLSGEFRYLDSTYLGNARVEYLPNDQVRGISRHAFSWQHDQVLAPNLTGRLNLNGVSDDFYYTDLSTRIGITSQTNLPRQGVLNYAADWWNAQAQILRYQTIQPNPAAPVPVPYQLTPQFTFNARQPDLNGVDAALLAQFTSFAHPTNVEGRRTVAYPQLALPYVQSGYYITPKVGVHFTDYSLTRQAIDTPSTLTRSVPIVSLDAGMTFERDLGLFGNDYVQTLEPRLFYLNVPAREQSKIPLFDTALADFNFTQVFAENLYTGQDRIADANQLTTALTSRLIDPRTGAETLRGMIGQRFYFRDQKVPLNPGDPLRSGKSSDFLAALTGKVMPKVFADAAVQYNTHDSQISRLTLAGRYQPEVGKVLNASYRYTRDVLGQIDVTGQWPVYGGWNVVGRYNYSIKEGRVVETIGGIEYDGGCWVGRAVLQRFAATADQPSTAVFLQLELNDFSRIGSNPLELLRRSIQGYGKINQSTSESMFGNP